jgi:hypothetical protein
MPYIDQGNRGRLEHAIDNLTDRLANDGELNYTITRLVAGYFARNGWRYDLIARAVGALECVKLEFYRRVAGPYEDKAIAKNGDLTEYQ